MAVSVDVGTMFITKCEIDPVIGDPNFTTERNVFIQTEFTQDTELTLKENNWSYVKHEDKFFILSEDAIKLKNLVPVSSNQKEDNTITTKMGDLRRPMKDGVLNTGEEKLSVAIIQKIIGNLVGKPKTKNEVLCFCAPGDPVDKNFNIIFHKTMLTNFFKSLGYKVECIPEALAIIFSERPVATTDDGEESPFTGVAFSFGSGMANVCFCLKKIPLINFSVARSGDYIDREAARTAGVGVSVMTRFKETQLDLSNVNYSDIKQAALDIFYQNMIEHALNNFAEKFNQLENPISFPIEIVVAGGTASVPGFMTKFESVINSLELPFKIKGIKLAENPRYTVANGCLIKAMSVENKAT